MESIIKEANPDRWERYRLRKGEDKEGDGEGEARPEGENPPEPPAAADGEEDAVYSEGEAGPEDLFGYNGPEAASALTFHTSLIRSLLLSHNYVILVITIAVREPRRKYL